jgi:hypothetical protein
VDRVLEDLVHLQDRLAAAVVTNEPFARPFSRDQDMGPLDEQTPPSNGIRRNT